VGRLDINNNLDYRTGMRCDILVSTG
jgi:hypothetical protein